MTAPVAQPVVRNWQFKTIGVFMLSDGDYHELWVLAQLHHDEGIEDGVCRIKKFLEESAVCVPIKEIMRRSFSPS